MFYCPICHEAAPLNERHVCPPIQKVMDPENGRVYEVRAWNKEAAAELLAEWLKLIRRRRHKLITNHIKTRRLKMTKNCRYILKASSPECPRGVYCEKPVKWKILRDDDNNRYRKYNTFCDKHQVEVDNLPNDDEEWDFE